jgi:hypothetical protein
MSDKLRRLCCSYLTSPQCAFPSVLPLQSDCLSEPRAKPAIKYRPIELGVPLLYGWFHFGAAGNGTVQLLQIPPQPCCFWLQSANSCPGSTPFREIRLNRRRGGGEIGAGERLPESDLARGYGVSRIPLRA